MFSLVPFRDSGRLRLSAGRGKIGAGMAGTFHRVTASVTLARGYPQPMTPTTRRRLKTSSLRPFPPVSNKGEGAREGRNTSLLLGGRNATAPWAASSSHKPRPSLGGCSSDCDLQLHRLPPDELLAGGIWGITTRRRRCQAPALRRPPSPNREKVTAGGALTRPSSSSSSRSDFGPFSALRSCDDADPRELAGEGWDSDAD